MKLFMKKTGGFSQKEVLTNISHELKNTITNIKEAISLLSDLNYHKLDSKSQKIILIAKEEIDRLIRMVNNLLKSTALEAQKLQLHKQPTQIEQIIQQVLESQSITIQKKEIEIETLYIPKSPLVDIDRDQLYDVIANLIDNAVKYTPRKGKITIQTVIINPTTPEYRKYHLNSKASYLKVSITDTGPGIPQKALKRIFDKYVRLDSTTSVKGIGLGLNIAKNIIKLHRGKIWAISKPNQGATFCFVLPIIQSKTTITK